MVRNLLRNFAKIRSHRTQSAPFVSSGAIQTPVQTADAETLTSKETTGEATGLARTMGRTQLLLIDDDESVFALIDHAFQKHGNGQYELTWAQCLKDGMRELVAGAIDVVLLDLGLPETTGAITYACVRGCAPQVPIIALTAEDREEIEESMVAAGVDQFLFKPKVSEAAVVQTVEAVLQKKQRPPQMNLRSR
jgi:CheY-like chemotaxis protein